MNWEFSKRVAIALPVTFAVLIASAFLSYENIERVVEANKQVESSLQVLEKLVNFSQVMLDAENSQRGYLLTGDERYLEPYNRAKFVDRYLLELRGDTITNPNHQKRLDRLEQLVSERLVEFAATINLRERQGLDAVLALGSMDRGKVMDEIRQRVNEMRAEEQNLLRLRSEQAAASTRFALASAVVSTVSGIAIVAILVGLMAREVRIRQHAQSQTLRVQTQLTNVLDTMNEAFVYLDPQWRITYVNPRFAQVVEQKQNALMGKFAWDAFRDGKETEFYRIAHQAMATQRAAQFEERYLPWNLWFEVRMYPAREGLAVFLTDITVRRTGQDRIQNEVRRTQTLLRNAERFNAHTRLDRALAGIARDAAHALSAPVGMVMLADDKHQLFKLRGVYGLPHEGLNDIPASSQAVYSIPLQKLSRPRRLLGHR